MIITLCGSNKFKTDIKKLAVWLELAGHFVHMPAEFNSDIKEDSEEFYYIQKGLLLGHFRKIEQADLVVICNFNGYIGNSTAMELSYAYANNKYIIALTESEEMAHNVCVSLFCDSDWEENKEVHIKSYSDEILSFINLFK